MNLAKPAFVAVLCLAVLTAAALPAAAAAREDLATTNIGPAAVVWQPKVSFERMVLTLSGPHGVTRHEFASGSVPSLDVFASDGYPLPDGSYTWELSFEPVLSTHVKQAIANARATGDHAEVEALRQQGLIPDASLAQSGHLTVAGGSFALPDVNEPVGARPSAASAPISSAPGEGEIVSMSAADQVILDDLIVDGSACVGLDCVNGESFGFDTIRLKENNLRIKFQDTSASASFPSNDWQLTANDSSNGGANKFSIDDIDGGRTPFTIEASAPSHSLYVDDGGRVGLGTSTPVVELHVVNGDSPTLRLEQNGSSGFTPQTWDVVGNETNFFVRDATNGSQLPFRIRPSAPTNSIYVDTDGDIGMGTNSPASTSSLQIVANTGAANDVVFMQNDGPTRFALNNTVKGSSWRFNHVDDGTLRIATDDATEALVEMELDLSGNLTITGGLITGTAGSCNLGTECDGVFHPDFEVESIEAHAEYMWTESHLRGVGPTLPDQPINITRKTTGILNELEKAHIYIEQLNDSLKTKDAELDELRERMAALEQALGLAARVVQ